MSKLQYTLFQHWGSCFISQFISTYKNIANISKRNQINIAKKPTNYWSFSQRLPLKMIFVRLKKKLPDPQTKK